jgi:hypothetical protein
MRVAKGQWKGRIVETDEVEYRQPYWDGGSKDTYIVLDSSGREKKYELPHTPWPQQPARTTIKLDMNTVVLEESIFRGKKMPPTYYMTTELIDALDLRPPPSAPLSDEEVKCLIYLSKYKSCDVRRNALKKNNFETHKPRLLELGYIRKQGSITDDGRNAIENHPLRSKVY